jgi:hypothetical protein
MPTVDDGSTCGSSTLQVQEAAMAGESETVEKDAGIFGHGRQPGHGEGIVTATPNLLYSLCWLRRFVWTSAGPRSASVEMR